MTIVVNETSSTHPAFSLKRTQAKALYKPGLGILCLALFVLFSALAVVYTTDLNRRLFMQVQQLEEAQNQLHLEWGKLLLEQSTWSNQARLQTLAQTHFKMVAPHSSNTVILKPINKMTVSTLY